MSRPKYWLGLIVVSVVLGQFFLWAIVVPELMK